MKIFIADDSDLIRERIKESLSDIKEVDSIHEAKDGNEAVEMIIEKKPDLIFLDIRMPMLNGIGVLKKIREYGITSTVCMLTNFPYTQYKERCIKEGANFFYDKSSDFREIKNLVSDISENQNKDSE